MIAVMIDKIIITQNNNDKTIVHYEHVYNLVRGYVFWTSNTQEFTHKHVEGNQEFGTKL